MVHVQRALYVALFVASAAFGQFASPLVVLAPNAPSVDPSCVRLYEQRANGSNFVNLCAPNAVTSNNSISLPNSTIGGVLLMQPTASTPLNDFYVNTSYVQSLKIATPFTLFGTAWTLQSSGALMEVLDSAGSNFLTFDGSNNRIETEDVFPKPGSWDLGDPTRRYTNGFIDSLTSFTLDVGSIFSSALATVLVNDGLTVNGIIVPTFDNSFDLGRSSGGGFYWRSLYTKGSIFNSDGAVDRLQFSNPGLGSNSGAGLQQRNAAGSFVFRVFYNGNIETAYTGGGTVVACLNSGGILVRGISSTSC